MKNGPHACSLFYRPLLNKSPKRRREEHGCRDGNRAEKLRCDDGEHLAHKSEPDFERAVRNICPVPVSVHEKINADSMTHADDAGRDIDRGTFSDVRDAIQVHGRRGGVRTTGRDYIVERKGSTYKEASETSFVEYGRTFGDAGDPLVFCNQAVRNESPGPAKQRVCGTEQKAKSASHFGDSTVWTNTQPLRNDASSADFYCQNKESVFSRPESDPEAPKESVRTKHTDSLCVVEDAISRTPSYPKNARVREVWRAQACKHTQSRHTRRRMPHPFVRIAASVAHLFRRHFLDLEMQIQLFGVVEGPL